MLNRNRRWMISAVAGIVALVAVPLAAAQDMDVKTMTAEIVEVDVDTNRLKLKRMDAEIGEEAQSEEYTAEKKGLEKEIAVVIEEDTRITEDGGKIVSLADLEPGERVNVRYKEMDDGELSIIGIVVYTTTTG